jgi:N-acetylglucosamine-6-phosphate deacetylase
MLLPFYISQRSVNIKEKMKAFTNAEIFTGFTTKRGQTLIVDHDEIIDITEGTVTDGLEIIDMGGDLLAPAFIDIQLYGGKGLLFSETPSRQSITATYESALSGGAALILPTIATNSFEKIYEAVDAVRDYQQAGLPGVVGLHIEGPFINPVKKGAHVEQFIKVPAMDDVKQWMARGAGIIKIVTLAPEMCSDEVIGYLQQHGVVVSAGHTNATYQEACNAFEKGIKAVTHLFNAMSPFQHRAPGMIGAVFNASSVQASIVADGHHVDFAAIRIAKKIMNERLFLITDAVTENNAGYYQHQLQGDKYVLPDGTLSGSNLTMLKAVKNCIDHIEIPMEEALRMASLYPAQAVGLDKVFGRLEKGFRASFVRLNKKLELIGIFTNGEFTFF